MPGGVPGGTNDVCSLGFRISENMQDMGHCSGYIRITEKKMATIGIIGFI